MNILLHICCAPCACYCRKALLQGGHKATGYWYNHNIHPYTEYRKRLESLLFYANHNAMPLIVDDEYALETFIDNSRQHSDNRCFPCYEERLKKAASKAIEKRFDAFTTTLLYSKYQQHEMIKEVGEDISVKLGMEFYYEDFREGWGEGIKASKELGLYRQQYCGCVFSERDRYMPG